MNRKLIYSFCSMFKRDMINIVLNPVLFLTNTVFPFLLVIVLGHLAGPAYGGDVATSYDFYGVTVLIFTALNVSITASNSFMEQSLMASNLRVVYAPIPYWFIYVSKVLATFAFTAVCITSSLFLFGAIFQTKIGGPHAAHVAVILALLCLFSSALGVMFCCILRSEGTTNKILSTVNSLLALLGGLFFPVDGLGTLARLLSHVSPVRWVQNGVFQIIYDQDFSLYMPTILVLVGACLLALLGCKLRFRAEEYV